MASILKRRASRKKADARGQAAVDDALAKKYPALAEFLLCETWGKGEARQTGTIMVFAEDGSLKAWVHDRDQGQATFISAVGWDELLQTVDQGLAADDLEWRAKGSRGSGKRGHG